MTIQVGDTLPEVNVTTMTNEGPKPRAINELCSGKKVVLFAVPGAFTPTCSVQHLPGFVQYSQALKDKGVDLVACISVNDPFVMEAWGKSYNLKDQIILLADVNANFTKRIGAEFNWRGWGLRSKRYTMLIEDGVVKKLVEEEGKCELTAAENFLKDI